MIQFRFSLYVFFTDVFDGEFFHEIYQGKSVYDGQIPVDSRIRFRLCGQEDILMAGSLWRLNFVCEALSMFEVLFWCC